MLRLALRGLRHRPAAAVATVIALFAAAALLVGCGLLLQTGLQGSVAAERYAAAPVIVSGDQDAHAVKDKHGKTKTKSKSLAERVWIPTTTADTVAALPGVRVVRTEVVFPAYLVIDGKPVPGPHGGRSWGHGWDSAPLTPFTLQAGRAPATADEIVVDAALAERAGVGVGSPVTVQATAAPRRYRVVGITTPGPGVSGLASQSAVFFAVTQARTLAGHPGDVAALGVWPATGTPATTLAASIRRTLTGTPVTVSTGADRGAAEFPGAANATVVLVSLSAALGGSLLLTAMLVVAGMIGLRTQRGYRELALLRTIGATPRQIRALIGREALLLSAAGALPGSVAGLVVGRWLHDRLVTAGAIPPNLPLIQSLVPLPAAVVLTMAGAWVAARVAGRRAARLRPTAALVEATTPPLGLGRSRTITGAVLLAAGVVLVLVLRGLHTDAAATPVTLLTSLVWVAALTLLAPPVLRLTGAAVAVLLRGVPSASGYLAANNLRTGARRYASVAMPVLLTVSMSSTILFMHTSLEEAAQQQASSGVQASYVLRAANPGLPPTAAAAARRTPGVVTVTQVVRSTVRDASLGKYSVQGVTPAGLGQNLDLGVREGSLRELGPATAAISATAADRTGARVGQALRLYLGDGTPVTLRVIAMYTRGLGFPDLTLSHDLVAAHVDDPLDDVVLVHGASGLQTALQDSLRGYTGVQIVSGAKLRAAPATGQGANTAVQQLLLIMIVGFAAMSVVNTLIMTTTDRAHEFSALRLIGATRSQIAWMTQSEGVLLSLVGAALGTMVSVLTLSGYSAGTTGSLPHIPAVAYLTIIGSASALTLGATVVATRAALTATPLNAATARE